MLPQPVGTPFELNCRVNEGLRVFWSVTLPGAMRPVLINREDLIQFFMNTHGIIVELPTANNHQSPLRINGTSENNGTAVRCEAVDPLLPTTGGCFGQEVAVVFFGKNSS